jgi:hypothetical protein
MFMSETIINTKDPVTIFRRSIDKAISDATHGISTAEVTSYLRSRAQQIEDRNYRGRYTPPRMYDQNGKLIDYVKQADEARAARQRRIDAASEIPIEKRQHAASGYRAP